MTRPPRTPADVRALMAGLPDPIATTALAGRARLDPSGDSQPKTRLLGHVVGGDEGTCVAGPGDTWENVETGERIDLTVNRQAILDRSERE